MMKLTVSWVRNLLKIFYRYTSLKEKKRDTGRLYYSSRVISVIDHIDGYYTFLHR